MDICKLFRAIMFFQRQKYYISMIKRTHNLLIITPPQFRGDGVVERLRSAV